MSHILSTTNIAGSNVGKHVWTHTNNHKREINILASVLYKLK